MSELKQAKDTDEIDSMVMHGENIMSVNDTKRGAAILKAATPPHSPTRSRRKFSEMLTDAEWWIAEARKMVRKRDYAEARSHVLMACALLDNAMQYEVVER